MNKLIILDLYGTLVRADHSDGFVRPGFQEFWEHYSPNSKFALSSDGSYSNIRETLEKTGLKSKFNEIYNEYHMLEIDGRDLKDLRRILKDHSTKAKNAVFIGDNFRGCDECSAFYSKIPFVRVPQFRLSPPSDYIKSLQGDWTIYEPENEPFTFKSLIGKI